MRNTLLERWHCLLFYIVLKQVGTTCVPQVQEVGLPGDQLPVWITILGNRFATKQTLDGRHGEDIFHVGESVGGRVRPPHLKV